MSQKQVEAKVNEHEQNVEEGNAELRFAELDLDYYKTRIPPEQFRVLLEFLSYSAAGNVDPAEIFYPGEV